jgi:acyl carrier protein
VVELGHGKEGTAMTERERDDQVRKVVRDALVRASQAKIGPFADDEDLLDRFGLDSLQTFRFVVSIENDLGITIGADPGEFDRIRQLRHLRSLVGEKLGWASSIEGHET